MEISSVAWNLQVQNVKGFICYTWLIRPLDCEVRLDYPAKDVADDRLLQDLFLIFLLTFFLNTNFGPFWLYFSDLLDMEAFQFFVTHVEQETEEVLGVLLLILRVVVLQEFFEDLLAVYYFTAERFVELELCIEVFVNVAQFWNRAVRI